MGFVFHFGKKAGVLNRPHTKHCSTVNDNGGVRGSVMNLMGECLLLGYRYCHPIHELVHEHHVISVPLVANM